MLFEIEREVEQRLTEQSALVQQKRDEQAAQTSVAIQKRVDRFELDVGQRGIEQDGQAVGVIV